jgi:hypothetical protein
MLRGSRDFADREAYETFLRTLFAELNAGRQKRLNEELPLLRELPRRRLEVTSQKSPPSTGVPPCKRQQHDLREKEHLLGAQPPDRREG